MADLNKKLQEQAATITVLKDELASLRSEKTSLINYLNKLCEQGLKTRLKEEVKEVNQKLKVTTKQIDCASSKIKQLKTSVSRIESEIQELQGPMMKMLRTVLRKLGIELTVYWAGTFVGPQIAKLMHESRYKKLNIVGIFWLIWRVFLMYILSFFDW